MRWKFTKPPGSLSFYSFLKVVILPSGTVSSLLLDRVAAVTQNKNTFNVISFLLSNESAPTTHRTKRKRKDFLFTCETEEIAKEWTLILQKLILPNGLHRVILPEGPRRLTIFVNPFSGKKKGLKIWKEVHPILRLAGISLDIIGKLIGF